MRAGLTEAAIRSRLSWLEDGVVLLREWPAPTPETIDAMFDAVARMTAGRDRFVLLVDLTEAERPGAEVRQQVRERMSREQSRLAHVAMYTGGFFIAVAAKFIFSGMGVSISTHKHEADAIEAARRVAEVMRRAA